MPEMTELEKYTDKLTVQESNSASDSVALLPFVEVLTASGEKTGLAFHGVPGGHEFTSRFILGSGKFSLDLVKACIEKADYHGTKIKGKMSNSFFP